MDRFISYRKHSYGMRQFCTSFYRSWDRIKPGSNRGQVKISLQKIEAQASIQINMVIYTLVVHALENYSAMCIGQVMWDRRISMIHSSSHWTLTSCCAGAAQSSLAGVCYNVGTDPQSLCFQKQPHLSSAPKTKQTISVHCIHTHEGSLRYA